MVLEGNDEMNEKEKQSADNLDQGSNNGGEPDSTEKETSNGVSENLDLNLDTEQSENETSEDEDNSSEDTIPTYEELSLEVSELKDQLLRTVAESENSRRRMEREKVDSSKYAITNFARSILSVADNLKTEVFAT